MSDKTTGQARPAERRYNYQLRERFETAVKLLKPILAQSPSPNGTMLYRVMHQLQTAYPDLSASEIEALMAAVMRSAQNKEQPLRLVISN